MGSEWDRRPDALGTLRVLPDDTLCRILSLLTAKDVGKLACVSSVFNTFCNEEPLWMQLCLQKHRGSLDYKGTWKQTTLAKMMRSESSGPHANTRRHFQGFSSLFLYRRWYRCHVGLEEFALDNGAVERRSGVQPSEFSCLYDSKKPVLLTDLMYEWPARKSWSLDQLVQRCGDAEFKVSQPHGKSVPMKLKDFAAYMAVQHDEEPLYIFDPEFGETVPELLEDYKVPALFSDDLFSVLCESDRPPFRWLVLGPARSGASWHVDPSLTSAWNSLLCGRKRWALYPPGKVPPGMTLDMDEDDGSIHYDGPTSLQWWLDVYPHLKDGDKPLECTQLAGETIYVPSGWWHCVLNIDASVAVTQNFVNANNLEIVCMDLAPGYRHRAIARAGKIALEGQIISHGGAEQEPARNNLTPIYTNIPNAVQPSPFSPMAESSEGATTVATLNGVTDPNLLLALDALKFFTNEDRANSSETDIWRQIRESGLRPWLRRLWVARPELQQTLWKCACLALDAATWLHRINVICSACGLPRPANEDQLPVGSGSNPVYFVGDYVVKLYIQDEGPSASMDVLGSELNFYAVLRESTSPLNDVVPEVVSSGILYPDGESYKPVPWDGTGEYSLTYTRKDFTTEEYPLVHTNEVASSKTRDRDDLNKKLEGRFRTKWSRIESAASTIGANDPSRKNADLWPYLVTKRCPGSTLMELDKDVNDSCLLSLATSLGKYVGSLHTLPLFTIKQQMTWNCSSRSGVACQPDDSLEEEELKNRNAKQARHSNAVPTRNGPSVQQNHEAGAKSTMDSAANGTEVDVTEWRVTGEWEHFVWYLRNQRKSVHQTLRKWGSLPHHLLQQVETFLPKDPVVLVGDVEVIDGVASISPQPVWLHTDLTFDNILVEESRIEESRQETVKSKMESLDGATGLPPTRLPSEPNERDDQMLYIVDFGDLLRGDSLYELLRLYLDVFKLESHILERYLKSYRCILPSPQKRGSRIAKGAEYPERECQYKLSYCAMCYCLLHELDMFASVFALRRDLKAAASLEEIAEQVWGILDLPDSVRS